MREILKMKKLYLPVLFIAFIPNVWAEKLTMEDYIRQVQTGNLSIQASQYISVGAQLRSAESRLATMPMFFANAQWMNDEKPTSTPSITGSKSEYRQYSLGVSELFQTGTQLKASYNISRTDLTGASSLFNPLSQYYDIKPMVEISQSLWKNFFGAETRAQKKLIEGNALATAHTEAFKIRSKGVEAESAYTRLAFAKQMVNVQKDSYERALKLRDWNKKRAQSQLGDKVDLLQAESALMSRELEFQTAKDEESAAKRAFNSLRGINTDHVNEELEIIAPDKIERFKSIQRGSQSREDVLAAIELAKISDANAELGYQRARPTLEAYGSYAFNGRNVDQSEAHSDAFNNHHKTWIAGVRFSTSFDMGGAADVRAGYIQEQRAAELNLQRKLFDEQQDWKDLNHKFDELKRKFEMAKAIEMGQKEKLEYERNRFNRGRTTTYQVLMFEQDYALAQVNRIKTQSDFMQVLAQLKLFNETKLEELLPAENNSNTTGGAI